MPLHPQPPPEAWGLTVYVSLTGASDARRWQQARRIAGRLLRRMGVFRSVAAVHLAQIDAPGGAVEHVYPEAPAADA